jgi:hypothetical protein
MQADSGRRAGGRPEDGGPAGPECVIAVLPDGQRIGPAERRALRALADAGLIPAAGHTGHDGPSVTTRIRIHSVKARARVAESVEPALALH